MGGIAIIDLGKGGGHNAASPSDYGAIYNALGGSNGQQSLTSRYVVINGAGEAVSYSTQLGTLWTPQTVANRIKNQSIVWIDYCGFPFFYQVSAAGVSKTLGQSGWRQFASYVGYGWLNATNFIVPISDTQPIGRVAFPWARGFPLIASLDGVCYSNGSITIPGGLFGIGGGTFPLTANGYTAMFALHPTGGGYYFYATWTPQVVASLAELQGVDTTTYSTFIRDILNGDTAAYICQPYHIATQVATPATPGPSSPVIITTPRTTPRTTPKTTPVAGRTPIVPAGTAKTTSSAVVEDLLIGGTVVTGLGLVTVALLRHHQRTRR